MQDNKIEARTTKQGSSDVYIFFAGYGLASQSGQQMYLLPYDGSPRLLEDSAISRERLFSGIESAKAIGKSKKKLETLLASLK